MGDLKIFIQIKKTSLGRWKLLKYFKSAQILPYLNELNILNQIQIEDMIQLFKY